MPPAPLTLGRCRACLRAATRRGADWWHDPGVDCGQDGAEFVPVRVFDPIAPFWRIEDPAAMFLDLPTMLRVQAESGARALLDRYTDAFDTAGILDVAGVLAAAERARLSDSPDLPPFAGPALSSDYAPGNDEADEEEESWERPKQRQAEPEDRPPRRVLPIDEEPVAAPASPPEEWDDSPAPTTP